MKQIKSELLLPARELEVPASPSFLRIFCWVHGLKTTARAARALDLKLEHPGSTPGSATRKECGVQEVIYPLLDFIFLSVK